MELDRRRVLAYRVAAQGLDRTAPAEDAEVLGVGVQDTPYGSARLALAARATDIGVPGTSTLVWAARGAPHLHRRADLAGLAAALWPIDDADARARIVASQIKEGARLGLAAFRATAEALRAAVDRPMPKGEVSAAVSAMVPEALTYDCGPCGSRHISGGLFQQAGLAGGVRVETRGAKTFLAPLEGRADVPEEAAGTAELVRAYLRLLGPAGRSDVARYLGVSNAVVERVWPEGLTEVRVGGRRLWLPADRADALRSAPEPRLVRLLPPSDLYLLPRDRDLLVPDRARQREVWKVLGNPGALLVDGEIEGVWRARKKGRTRLEITITGFGDVPGPVREAAESEARRVADVREVPEVAVRFE